MSTYNGHRSWAYWNVSLWIGNDEGLYRLALDCIKQAKTRREAARAFIVDLVECGYKHRTELGAVSTPDGAAFSVDKVVCAMRGLS